MPFNLKRLSLVFMLIFLFAAGVLAQQGNSPLHTVMLNGADRNSGNYMINLYDNIGEERGGMISDWGFSMFVRYNGQNILFDGGASAQILHNNAEKAGINLKDIDFAILSHHHGDHTVGIHHLVEVNPDVTVYVPKDGMLGYGDTGDNKKYRKGYLYQQGNIVFIDKAVKIIDGVNLIFTTSSHTGSFSKYPPHEDDPALIPLPELSLALATGRGEYVIISGCSHSGIEEITKAAKDFVHSDILFVTGGCHLGAYDDNYIIKLAENMKNNLGVIYLGASHCTGNKAINLIKSIYGRNYIEGGLGTKIIFP
ncbi:MAG: MBL fold metallo-hydrolase [Candidatus Latescibacteria bacterium]|nr:MBL fold metallo-hydrolase [Candidatus Latescibacterota bacterium]